MVQWVSHGPCPGGIFNSCAMAALRSGHSHDDIDQCFGRLARWMQKKPYALEPSDFVPLINDFLKESDFPFEPYRVAFEVNRVRDWILRAKYPNQICK